MVKVTALYNDQWPYVLMSTTNNNKYKNKKKKKKKKKSVPCRVGVALLQGEYKEAVQLIMQPRDGEREETAEARRLYLETGSSPPPPFPSPSPPNPRQYTG